MPDLVHSENTKAILRRYDVRLQKKFGQNFLIDESVLSCIVEASGVTKDDFVLEIGPGIGTLTQALAEAAREVTAVEIDRELIPALTETLAAYGNVEILNADILKLDLTAFAEEKNGGKPMKIVANLPYYITTPIVMKLLETGVPFESVTVMVQREVAERMKAGPGTKDYGALSLAVRYYTEPEIVLNVPPDCFLPRPKVGSAVIRLTRHEKPPVEVKDEELLFRVIRAAFNQRRKTLVNALANAPGFSLKKEEIADCIEACGFSPTIRGEALTLSEFAELTDKIYERTL